ncbi:MAG TPA: 4-hydroxy-tetrahydrodipicolinate reductase [Actinobacteria bacterium]|nr:4-hydroxy-tetrahydrodipicolinate reductase [Actinomycetota bacterium]
MKVAVSGIGGRMGRLVAEAVAAAEDLELVAGYDPARAGSEIAGVRVSTSPDELGAADVVVEFTLPDVVMGNLRRWRRLGLDAVVGTSGFDEERLAALATEWGPEGGRCLVVPNFSIGAVVMMHLAEVAARHFAAAEIVELHHDRKADAPSGTATATAARIGAAGAQRRDVESTELVPGVRGGRIADVPVHSVRLPGLVAHQMVILGNRGETLTIRHDTTDREAFLPGVLLAVRGISGLPPGVTVGLESLLGIGGSGR